MSPFHDLDQRRGGPRPLERVLARSSGPTQVEDGWLATPDPRVISIPQFARMFSLGVLGLIALLSLGVGGVAFIQGYVSRNPKTGFGARPENSSPGVPFLATVERLRPAGSRPPREVTGESK
jgi:hypothetical protein